MFRVEAAASNGAEVRRENAAAAASAASSSGVVPERRSTRKRTHPSPLGAEEDAMGGGCSKEKRLTADLMYEAASDLVEIESSAVDVYFQPEIGNIHTRCHNR